MLHSATALTPPVVDPYAGALRGATWGLASLDNVLVGNGTATNISIAAATLLVDCVGPCYNVSVDATNVGPGIAAWNGEDYPACDWVYWCVFWTQAMRQSMGMY